MSTAVYSSRTIEKKIDSTVTKMEDLYAYARVLRSELDYSRGEYKTHTTAKSLIHELENQ